MAEKIWNGSVDGDWHTAGNWDGGIPVEGDNVVIPASATQDIDGTDATSSNIYAFVGFIVEEGSSIAIGSAATGLSIDMNTGSPTDVFLGGTGRTFIEIIDAADIQVAAAGAAPGVGEYSTNIIASESTAANNDIYVDCTTNQSVGIGAVAGTAAAVDSINVTGGVVTVGDSVVDSPGTGVPDLTMSGGLVETNSALGTVVVNAGILTHNEGVMADLEVWGGACNYNSDGTLSLAKVSGTLDFSGDLRTILVTRCDLYAGGVYRDPNKVVGLGAGNLRTISSSLSDITLDFGKNFKLVLL